MRRRQTDNSIAASGFGFETENRLDDVNPEPFQSAGRRPSIRKPEVPRPRFDIGVEQLAGNALCALGGRDVPGEREQVAPMAVIAEQARERLDGSTVQRGFKRRQPFARHVCAGVALLGHLQTLPVDLVG